MEFLRLDCSYDDWNNGLLRDSLYTAFLNPIIRSPEGERHSLYIFKTVVLNMTISVYTVVSMKSLCIAHQPVMYTAHKDYLTHVTLSTDYLDGPYTIPPYTLLRCDWTIMNVFLLASSLTLSVSIIHTLSLSHNTA